MASKAETYAMLSAMLPIRLDPDRQGDLLYRINHYAESALAVPGLRINRLRSWHGIVYKLGTASIGGPRTTILEQGACLLELDINTDAERTEAIPAERLPQLFRELAEFGAGVIARGEHD
jgi:hypothetical protein